ncbi:MAG: transpeptidase family protein [Oligoflexia bacterium]|nr:transpeptidase family protein [Oligoflexia bacterium]
MVDVPTGEILAMASVPGLDPNDQAHLDMARLKNRAAMDAIEPGSVFKPFIAAAALDTGTITATTPLYCEMGAWRLGHKTIHDEHRLGDATLGDVIKFSSNICAAKLALALGAENALGYLSDFGFGRSTGLGLPGETRGMLRKVKGIRRIELATTGYGYGTSVSAVQLAAAVATLGNGGVRMEPRLIKAVTNGRGDLIERFPPKVDRRVVSEKNARQVVDMMVAVTEKHGTGTRAAVCGYKVAGKTGTSKKLVNGAYSPTERMGSWIGLIPADAPKLAIVVVVDNPTLVPRYGGWTAGPAFKEIAGKSMRLLGVPPDPSLFGLKPQCDGDMLAKGSQDAAATKPLDSLKAEPARPPVELRWNDDGSLRTPDLAGLSMRDALVALEGAGLGLRVSGSGRVKSQNPMPGASLAPGDAVAVVLR